MPNHDPSVWPDHARGDGRGNEAEGLERSAAWKAADEARARANEARQAADEANAEANRLEAKATAEFEGVEHTDVNPDAGTWEAAVGGGTSEPAAKAAPGEATDSE